MRRTITKYLPDSDLVRLQSISALCQDIAYIFNKVLRPADPSDRINIKTRIRDKMVLLHTDFNISKIRLGVKDSIQIHMDQNQKRINEYISIRETPRLYIKYSNISKTVDISLSDIRMVRLLSIIKELTKIRDKFVDEFNIDTSELGGYKQLPAKIVKDELGNIVRYLHGGTIVQNEYDKYWYIYTKFVDHQNLDKEISGYMKLNRDNKSIEVTSNNKDSGYILPIKKVIVATERDINKDMLPSKFVLNNIIKAIRERYPI